jgi:hypothetical protein
MDAKQHDLFQEGREPSTSKYHRRKVLVWDCIAELVRAGFTSSHVAIDRVYEV